MNTFATLSDCEHALADWHAEKRERLAVAINRSTAQMQAVKDWTAQLNLLADHSDSLGFVNECIPEAEDYLQQAKALATESFLAEHPGITPTTLKTLVEGRIHNFTRTARMLDRLSATLTHRMEALRTIISAGKEMYRQEIYSPKQRG